MPGSNNNSTYEDVFGTQPVQETVTTYTNPYAPKTAFYSPKSFDYDEQLRLKYGTDASRRDQRKFKKYWNSDQRHEDQLAFDKAETDKMFANADARFKEINDAYKTRNSVSQAITAVTPQKPIVPILASTPVPTAVTTPPPALKPRKTNADWNAIAVSKLGEGKTMQDVIALQKQLGVDPDGKWGSKTQAAYDAYLASQKAPAQDANPEHAVRSILERDAVSIPTQDQAFTKPASVSSPIQPTTRKTQKQIIENNDNLRYHYGTATKHVDYKGNRIPLVVTTGLGVGNQFNDMSFYYDEASNRYLKAKEGLLGAAYGFDTDASGNPISYTWEQIQAGSTESPDLLARKNTWLQNNPKPKRTGFLGGMNTQEYNDWYKSYQQAYQTEFKKQGGIMNKIKYFQQGGVAPQQDMKQQVVALVQAAMQGDKKATQTVNQIMEAAKAGDQQAMQIAQLMEQVIKELQGQATSAKWGAKLSYIKSLKYAKGGKTCPACEKKVEMKACGGKKAKKRYFGGLV